MYEASTLDENIKLKLPQPSGYRILIALPDVSEKTAGGVYMPDSLKSAEEVASILGFVLKERPIQFLAEEEGRVVGWCDVTPDTREGFRHQGILGIGVLPGFRRRGIGRALLGRTVRAGLESGLIRIELEVFGSNGRAIRMYERGGFQVEGRKRLGRILDGEIEDVVIMALLKPEGA